MELKLGSIPVKVQGWFVLMALFLGANEGNPLKLGIWVGIVLVSVLLHELGHALMGKAFGLDPRIELHGMGGTTSFSSSVPRGPLGNGKRIAISLAGPFAGFGFAAIVFVAQAAGLQPRHPLSIHAVSLLFAVNVGWGIFNLLPMLPLDGGDVLRSGLDALSKKNGERIARYVSVVVAACLSLYAVRQQAWWILYLGVLFAFRNVQAIHKDAQDRANQSLVDSIQNAHDALEGGDSKRAIALLQPAFVPGASTDVRQVGLRIWISALLTEGQASEAADLIERERILVPTEDLARYAKVLRDHGDTETADRVDSLQQVPSTELAAFRT